MPAKSIEVYEDEHERFGIYLAYLDDASQSLGIKKITERSVQAAICMMMRDAGLKPKMEQSPSKDSRMRMDVSGEGYIVEVKMSFDSVLSGVGQLLYYANKRCDGSRMILAIHADEDAPFDLVDFCDEHYITLCKAEDCALIVHDFLKSDEADDKLDAETYGQMPE